MTAKFRKKNSNNIIKFIFMGFLSIIFIFLMLSAMDKLGVFFNAEYHSKEGDSIKLSTSGNYKQEPVSIMTVPEIEGFPYTHYRIRNKIPVTIITKDNIELVRENIRRGLFMPTNTRPKVGCYIQYSGSDKQPYVQCPYEDKYVSIDGL